MQAPHPLALYAPGPRHSGSGFLATAINASPVVAITWVGAEGCPVAFVSDNVSQWGYHAADWMRQQLRYLDLVHPDDLDGLNTEVEAKRLQGVENYVQHYRLRTADGRWAWVEDRTWMEYDAAGTITWAHGVLLDISARKQQEQVAELERQTLERLLGPIELQPLLEFMVRGYQALMPGRLFSVLLLDLKTSTVLDFASPDLPIAFRQAIDGLAIGPQAGSCGSAAFLGHAVIVPDIATDPLWADYKHLALPHGLAACWSLPIKGPQGQVLGTFAVYTPHIGAPSAADLATLERGAYLAGLAIDRHQSLDKLLKLQQAVEQSPSSIVIANLDAEIEYANAAFFQATGYTAQEVLGQNPRLLQSGKTPPSVYREMWAALGSGRRWEGELINRRKDGSEYTEMARLAPIVQADGRITHYVGIKEDITQRKLAEQQIERLAFFDQLTGLPNRQLLHDRFHQAASQAQRHHQQMALMYIDLDNFKHINDTLGHHLGDELLLRVAQRLSAQVRAGDTLSRQGGDEFVLLLPECDQAAASLVADKLIEQAGCSLVVGAHEVTATLSVGIALYPHDGDTLDELARCADMAMYQAKQEGRSTFRFFTPALRTHSSRTLRLRNDLRLALERGQLALVYQPQVRLADGKMLGVEALLRWQHPELGPISPAEFIPIAETCGLILPIGDWVLRQGLQQLQRWDAAGLGALTVAVNLSAVQFRDLRLAERIGQLLHESGLPAQRLEIELTESCAMINPQGSINTLEGLRQLQIPIAIDDFGTGYSSLSYLKRFKVGRLKIDQSFVRDLHLDPDDRAIVRAIIGLADHLGMRTVAEGVETAEQLAWLREHGCDEAQGYFFSRPLSPEAMQAWALARAPQQPAV
ncbi:predicted signal transduction protein containing a membrane domain, an EAL and a GGDEF domain [Serpentinimonas raichei]|uniref:Predicted signal transduction protein containing a membrane domain, an EAL and a GGDEF domain n=1 Tax=Serpentinimonas raichei TaxID=1458425 RepID=A0A060NJF2_9BURK|nr:EAL domain-containing protein [Serpentinimonas raichei]BAO81677.1 predicted signal transduction protein containing a membrane domain, an EAL and a GGDEF domain [Serpentinimonas raichei]